jgi:hypothetical protein
MTNTHSGFKVICVIGGIWSMYFTIIDKLQTEKQLKLLNDISNKCDKNNFK